MGEDDRVFHFHDGRVREVRDVDADLAGLEGLRHGLVVDQGVAGEVQEADAVFHFRDGLAVDRVLRGLHVGHMDGQEIGDRKEVVEGGRVADLAGEAPCRVDGEERIVAVDGHTEVQGRVRDLGADRTETYDAERLALDLVAGEGFLGLLGVLLDIFVLRVCADPVSAADNVAGGEDEAGDDQLLDRVRVCARGVEDDDAFLGAAVDRDVVDACAGTGDGAEFGRELHFLHIRGADEDAGGFVRSVNQRVAFAEAAGPDRADVVETVDFAIFHNSSPHMQEYSRIRET